MRNGTSQKIRGGNKIGVKDGNQIPSRDSHTRFQRTRFISCTVIPSDSLDIDTLRFEFGDAPINDFPGFVGGVIENLNLEQMTGVIERGYRANETLDYVYFVVDRELNRNRREAYIWYQRLRNAGFAVFEI